MPGRGPPVLSPARSNRSEVTADHLSNDLGQGGVRHGRCRHPLTVTEDGHTINEIADLLEPVRHKEHGHPVVAHPADMIEQAASFGCPATSP